MRTIDTIGPVASGSEMNDRHVDVRRSGLKRALSAFFRRIDEALERRRQRRDLMALTDQQLKDIGVSRSMAFREASRPFWE